MRFGAARARYGLADALAVLSILAATVLYYRSVTLSNSIFVGFDIFTYFYPNEQFAVDSLLKGSLPLWNPYLFSGVPFVANMQTGVFYPFNLIFLLFSVPRAYAYSAVFHVFLAALNTYSFCRVCLKLRPMAALGGAFTFAFSGFVGALVGHINQLQAASWLPLLLLLAHAAWVKRSPVYGVLGGVALALQLLAGHAQESYMTLAALLLFLAYQALWGPRRWAGNAATMLLPFLSMAVVGAGLAAVQLIPAAEVSALSIRAGGMTYAEAVSFSFPPWQLLKGLFPAYADPQPFSEYAAYVGAFGMFIGLVAIATALRRPFVAFFVFVAAASIFFALGQFNPLYPLAFKLVPGLNLFRAPARWLFLYTFSASVLVSIGTAAIETRLREEGTRKVFVVLASIAAGLAVVICTAFVIVRASFPTNTPSAPTMVVWGLFSALAVAVLVAGNRMGGRAAQACAVCLILVELFAAGHFLDLSRANVPEAYASMRPAVAYLLADKGVFRMLALSENTFDPGDISEIKSMLGKTLDPAQVYDFLVATKLKETLMPNVPLRYSIATFDGYDGGVLPLKRYATFKELLAGKGAPDARLREELKELPDSRTLGWLNIKYILMDRIRDAWVDGVYYDLGIKRKLDASGESLVLTSLPASETTSIGIVSHLVEGSGIADGTPVATVSVADSKGNTHEFPLRAGVETSEGRWAEASERSGVKHKEARKAGAWKGEPRASDYLGLISLPEPVIPRSITIRYTHPRGQLVVKGISEIDGRTQTSNPVTLSDAFKLVHIGDVKIYENKEVLPRAFVVHEAVAASSDESALQTLGEGAFRPDKQVVLFQDDWRRTTAARPDQVDSGALLPAAQEAIRLGIYEPTRVVVQASLQQAGFIVLTDSYYPGWRAFVDGRESPLLRADYMFRAVEIGPEDHQIEFRYEPATLAWGGIISLLTATSLGILAVWHLRDRFT